MVIVMVTPHEYTSRHMALAISRKYRPQKLSDLLGQETVVELLQSAAKQDRIGHAYLFYGPRGTGKTTAARLIAKLANCEKRKSDAAFRGRGEPCNECQPCTAITNGSSLDVVEIDAASNRGIDEIRDLKESVTTAPASSAYKVYIIDEAHMLTGPAFNALLKTLEEPPAHAIFILATTEYEKLPATITSRTQRFLFKKQAKRTIVEKLTSIAKVEGILIAPDALELIAAAADGSFRDAESLLQQLGTMEETVDLATAERLTGRTGLQKVDRLAELLLAGMLPAALELIASLAGEGHNPVQFTKDLIHYLRKAVALKANPALADLFRGELTADEFSRLERLAAKVSPETHVKLLKALIRAYGEMQYSPFATIPLEIALIEQLH